MGLQLLAEEKNYDSMTNVVKDSTNACLTAMGILNDLLLYDKIEEGNMILDLQEINVKPFLIQCIQMFHVQVRKVNELSYII